jgi:hypothetical protein
VLEHLRHNALTLTLAVSTVYAAHPAPLQEFQPWLKWIIFDAALTVVVGQLVKHVEFVRPMFEAVGWA